MTAFRGRETLRAWLEEFVALGYRTPGTLRMIDQDGSDGADDGLVVFTFDGIPIDVYVQPTEAGREMWSVTIEPRESPSELNAAELTNWAAELVGLSALVTFLETKAKMISLADE